MVESDPGLQFLPIVKLYSMKDKIDGIKVQMIAETNNKQKKKLLTTAMCSYSVLCNLKVCEVKWLEILALFNFKTVIYFSYTYYKIFM